MLSVIAELHFEGVRVVSVADGLDSEDEGATLGIQIRGIFKELQLRDLKKKTLRRQMGQKERGFSREQGGREKHFPTHLLSGSMVCGGCGATIAQVSGKAGGYYGCLGAAKGACDNKVLVRRKLAETIILKAVREQLGCTEHIRYLLEQVETEVAKLYAHIPETVHTKEAELGAEERRLANFVDFIGEARGSRALAKALVETERRVEALREELDGLRRGSEKVFQAPPVEWVEERLVGMQELLERRTERSARLLRALVGKIELEPTKGQIGRPFYLARTSLDTPALLAPPPGQAGPDGGSNSLQWWSRAESHSPGKARSAPAFVDSRASGKPGSPRPPLRSFANGPRGWVLAHPPCSLASPSSSSPAGRHPPSRVGRRGPRPLHSAGAARANSRNRRERTAKAPRPFRFAAPATAASPSAPRPGC